jgi:hypothetical protein
VERGWGEGNIVKETGHCHIQQEMHLSENQNWLEKQNLINRETI